MHQLKQKDITLQNSNAKESLKRPLRTELIG
jgi:hypothetical protein